MIQFQKISGRTDRRTDRKMDRPYFIKPFWVPPGSKHFYNTDVKIAYSNFLPYVFNPLINNVPFTEKTGNCCALRIY